MKVLKLINNSLEFTRERKRLAKLAKDEKALLAKKLFYEFCSLQSTAKEVEVNYILLLEITALYLRNLRLEADFMEWVAKCTDYKNVRIDHLYDGELWFCYTFFECEKCTWVTFEFRENKFQFNF